MKHYLLNHQPQKGLQAACAQQGQAPTCNARGKGRTPASPKTLTRILLVLLTTLLLPSAAWGERYTTGSYNNEYNTWTVNDASGEPITKSWSITSTGTLPTITYNTGTGLNIAFSTNAKQANLNFDNNNYGAIRKLSIKFKEIPDGINPYSVTIKKDESTNVSWTSSKSGNTYTYIVNPRSSWESISIFLNYTGSQESADLTIESISFLTGVDGVTYYDLWVSDTEVTSLNATDIIGSNISNGKVSFTPANGDTPATLTLKGATINGDIQMESSADNKALIINLDGKNEITYGTISFSNSQYHGDLTFKGTGSLNIGGGEAIFDGVNSVNTSNGLYIATDFPNPYCQNGFYLSRLSSDNNEVTSATISTSVTYPIWVYKGDFSTGTGFTQVTDANKSNILGDDDVKLSYKNNILTLNGFTANTYYTGENYTYFMTYIGNELENLTVNLANVSEIEGKGFYFEKENATLSFTTGETPGKLTISDYDNVVDSYQSTTVKYKNDLGNYFGEISVDWPRLVIGETKVTGNETDPIIVKDFENNTVSTGTISFNKETNTLSLTDNATIGTLGSVTDIFVYIKDLTVEISGSNTLYGRFWGGYEENDTKGTIFFKKASNEQETTSLTISGIVGGQGPVYDFSKCTWDENLYLTEANDESGNVVPATYFENGSFKNDNNIVIKTITISTTKPSESIWIGGEEVNDDGTFDITFQNGSVIFDKEEKILTLDKVIFPIENHNIVSNLPNLTIKLANGASAMYSNFIISSNPTATLTFITDDNSDLNFYTGTDLPWKGFADNPTFKNQLVFLKDGDSEFIRVLSAPGMSYSDSDSKLTLSDLGYSNSQFSYYYAITYADNKGNISKTKKTLICQEGYQPTYSDDITITHTPFTVEASVVFEDQFGNTTESKTTIGKYFSFAESMILTTLASETEEKEIVLPALLPATEENDGITFELSSGNENIIYKNDDSKWMIKGYGNTFISAVIETDDTTPFTVLNEGTSLVVNVLHNPTFTAYYGEDNTKVYDGNGSGNVSVEISSSDDDDLGSEYSLMYYLGTDNTTPTPYEEAISLNSTTTVNAFIRYVNSDNSSITYDSEPVSMEYLVSQKLETPAFEGNINFQTCYLKDYSLAKPAGLKVYIITEISLTDNTLKAVSIDYIPKYVPVLLEKEGETPEGGYVAATYTGEEEEFSNNKLYYTDYQIDDLTGTEYVLFNNEFVKATGIIAAGHCYLSLDGPHANTRGFSIDTSGNGTTGIKNASLNDNREVMTKQWYDLQGRKIQKPTKAGLYIVNGKKVVIK